MKTKYAVITLLGIFCLASLAPLHAETTRVAVQTTAPVVKAPVVAAPAAPVITAPVAPTVTAPAQIAAPAIVAPAPSAPQPTLSKGSMPSAKAPSAPVVSTPAPVAAQPTAPKIISPSAVVSKPAGTRPTMTPVQPVAAPPSVSAPSISATRPSVVLPQGTKPQLGPNTGKVPGDVTGKFGAEAVINPMDMEVKGRDADIAGSLMDGLEDSAAAAIGLEGEANKGIDLENLGLSPEGMLPGMPKADSGPRINLGNPAKSGNPFSSGQVGDSRIMEDTNNSDELSDSEKEILETSVHIDKTKDTSDSEGGQTVTREETHIDGAGNFITITTMSTPKGVAQSVHRRSTDGKVTESNTWKPNSTPNPNESDAPLPEVTVGEAYQGFQQKKGSLVNPDDPGTTSADITEIAERRESVEKAASGSLNPLIQTDAEGETGVSQPSAVGAVRDDPKVSGLKGDQLDPGAGGPENPAKQEGSGGDEAPQQ